MMYNGEKTMGKIVIIGAAILDVLVRPADPEVFLTGSTSAEAIHVSAAGFLYGLLQGRTGSAACS